MRIVIDGIVYNGTLIGNRLAVEAKDPVRLIPLQAIHKHHRESPVSVGGVHVVVVLDGLIEQTFIKGVSRVVYAIREVS